MNDKYEINCANFNDRRRDYSDDMAFTITRIRNENPCGPDETNRANPRSFDNFSGTAEELVVRGLKGLLQHLFHASRDEAVVTGLVHRNKKYKPQCKLRWRMDDDNAYPRLWPSTREQMFKFRAWEPTLCVFSVLGHKYDVRRIWFDFLGIDKNLADVGFLRISRPYDESPNSALQCNALRNLTAELDMTDLYLHQFCCISEHGQLLGPYREYLLGRFRHRWETSDDHHRRLISVSNAVAILDGLNPGYVLNTIPIDAINDGNVTFELHTGSFLDPSSIEWADTISAAC